MANPLLFEIPGDFWKRKNGLDFFLAVCFFYFVGLFLLPLSLR